MYANYNSEDFWSLLIMRFILIHLFLPLLKSREAVLSIIIRIITNTNPRFKFKRYWFSFKRRRYSNYILFKGSFIWGIIYSEEKVRFYRKLHNPRSLVKNWRRSLEKDIDLMVVAVGVDEGERVLRLIRLLKLKFFSKKPLNFSCCRAMMRR